MTADDSTTFEFLAIVLCGTVVMDGTEVADTPTVDFFTDEATEL